MKEHRGRKVTTKAIKSLIIDMRDNKEMSFVEIAKEVGLKSRQSAMWHYNHGKELNKGSVYEHPHLIDK